jgi:hypothetical protein
VNVGAENRVTGIFVPVVETEKRRVERRHQTRGGEEWGEEGKMNRERQETDVLLRRSRLQGNNNEIHNDDEK